MSYFYLFIFLKGVLDPKQHTFSALSCFCMHSSCLYLSNFLSLSVFQLQTFQVPSCASKHELTSGVAIAHVLNKMWVWLYEGTSTIHVRADLTDAPGACVHLICQIWQLIVNSSHSLALCLRACLFCFCQRFVLV